MTGLLRVRLGPWLRTQGCAVGRAELIDQVRFTPRSEYAFHHSLIRAVAYESQLKSDRAQWHRRLAAAIEQHDPGSADENAAPIAEHLEAAGELRAAYGWHMRDGAWSTDRDLDAAWLSWERARRIADRLPADDPDQLSMRIAPTTMLCATDYQDRTIQESRGRFAELRELCSAAGDKVSLAIGMSGLATELCYAGRSREGSRLASKQMALLDSIGDPTPTMALAFIGYANWGDGDSSHEVSVQVNASGSHRAEDKHGLRPPPVAGIPAVAALGLILLLPQVLVHLGLERRRGRLVEQPVRAHQLTPSALACTKS